MQWYFNYIIFSSIYYRNKRKGKGSILCFRQERRETKLESLIDQPSIMYDLMTQIRITITSFISIDSPWQ